MEACKFEPYFYAEAQKKKCSLLVVRVISTVVREVLFLYLGVFTCMFSFCLRAFYIRLAMLVFMVSLFSHCPRENCLGLGWKKKNRQNCSCECHCGPGSIPPNRHLSGLRCLGEILLETLKNS